MPHSQLQKQSRGDVQKQLLKGCLFWSWLNSSGSLLSHPKRVLQQQLNWLIYLFCFSKTSNAKLAFAPIFSTQKDFVVHA